MTSVYSKPLRIRIQPYEIEVPEDDPFAHDLLDRKETIKVLTHLVSTIEGPCVLAIDAAWGNGKTTFLRIWTQYLRNLEFPVVEFNAWTTDFSGDPFVALSTELLKGFQDFDELKGRVATTRKHATEVLRRAIPGVVRLATAGVLDLSPSVGTELGNAFANYAESKLADYQEAQKSFFNFKRNLEEMANTLAESNENRPLIVVIDELDRCRPSYAVELLEVAKHLFAVDNIVFVIAVNRSELAHSIKALYGHEFDAQGYLRRFVDVDFRLPDPGRVAFINAAFRNIKIGDYIERTKDSAAVTDSRDMRPFLHAVFGDPSLSLRQVGQAMHRLGLVFASLQSNARSFSFFAAVALVVRTVDESLYHRYCDGKASDLEVVSALNERFASAFVGQKSLRIFMEAVLVVGGHEIANSRSWMDRPIDSPLLNKYQEIIQGVSNEGDTPSEQQQHAQSVVNAVSQMTNQPSYFHGIGFKHVVERIELFSGVLIGDSETQEKD